MDRNKICEAMYALPGGVVVKRRKSQLRAAVLFIAGVALEMCIRDSTSSSSTSRYTSMSYPVSIFERRMFRPPLPMASDTWSGLR